MAARKKARKGKKAAGKKAPKKPASTKKGKKKKKKAAAPSCGHEFIIRLMSDDTGVDASPVLSRKRGDLVMWVNESTFERRLEFNGGVWPFKGAPCEIIVPLDGHTGWYKAEKRAGESGVVAYSYSSNPAFAPGGPPGDPVMDTGD